MAKHTSKEAYFQRLQNLAEVNKTSLKESKIRNLGSLIDYKRAADGVAYGIVKENHLYYLKKAGTKQDPNVSDFAYIGGLGNITNFQYKSLSEADKQRNMIFHTINEAVTLKPNKTSSKMVLREDVAGKEIDMAAEKIGDLDAATSAEEMPAEPEGGEGSAEMAAGLEAEPEGGEVAPEGGEELPVGPEGGEELPAGPEGGEEAPEGGEEVAPEGGEELPAGPEGGEDEGTTELQKNVSSVAKEIQTSDLDKGEVKWLLDRFLRAFLPTEGVSEAEGEEPAAPVAGGSENKMAELEIEDRQELADMILNVVPDEDKASLADSLPPEEQPEAGVAEQQCAECGSFAKFAESRGYSSAEALKECGEEEVGNLVSGYANAHNDGQNDGDLENVALIVKIVNPEILNQLKGDYGHEDYANKLEPIVTGMNESSEEDMMAKFNEGFGGFLKGAGQALANKAGNAISTKFNQVTAPIKQAYGDVKKFGADIKQAGQAQSQQQDVKKVEASKNTVLSAASKLAADLSAQIAQVNATALKLGVPGVDVKSILGTISATLSPKTGKKAAPVAATVGESVAVDPSNTQVGVPNMLKEEDEELEDSPEHEAGETPEEEKAEHLPGGEEFEKSGDKPLEFAPAAQSLGVATVKPDGAPTTGVDITISPDKAVNISMNESEKKLRKYIRERLEVKAGLRKASLNEGKKSATMKKLDAVIDSQFKLYENVVAKKKVNEGQVNEILGFSIREKFAKLDPNDAKGVTNLFIKAYRDILSNPQMGAVGRVARRTTVQQRYDLLKQYVDGNGGTLRLTPDGTTVQYQPEELKRNAMEKRFSQGGTQGKTQMGGV